MHVTTLPSYPLCSIPLKHEPNPNYWLIRYPPRRLLSSVQPNNNNNINEQKSEKRKKSDAMSEAFFL